MSFWEFMWTCDGWKLFNCPKSEDEVDAPDEDQFFNVLEAMGGN